MEDGVWINKHIPLAKYYLSYTKLSLMFEKSGIEQSIFSDKKIYKKI